MSAGRRSWFSVGGARHASVTGMDELERQRAAQHAKIAEIWMALRRELDLPAIGQDWVRGPKALVFARQVAMYAAYHLTDASLPTIARAFGKADHTTALHACRRVAARLHDPFVQRALQIAARSLQPALTKEIACGNLHDEARRCAKRAHSSPASEARVALRSFLDEYGRRTHIERSAC